MDLYFILKQLERLDRKMSTLDEADADILAAIGQLPALLAQAVANAVAAANNGDAAALQAALQHQQNVADSLEQGVADLHAAFDAPAPDPTQAPVISNPTGAPPPQDISGNPEPIVVTDSNGNSVAPVPASPETTSAATANVPAQDIPSDTPIGDGITPPQ